MSCRITGCKRRCASHCRYIYGVSGSYEYSFVVAGAILLLGSLSASGPLWCRNGKSTVEFSIAEIKSIRNCNSVDANIDASLCSLKSGNITEANIGVSTGSFQSGTITEVNIGASISSLKSGSVVDLISCSKTSYFKNTDLSPENLTDSKEENRLLGNSR